MPRLARGGEGTISDLGVMIYELRIAVGERCISRGTVACAGSFSWLCNDVIASESW